MAYPPGIPILAQGEDYTRCVGLYILCKRKRFLINRNSRYEYRKYLCGGGINGTLVY